MSGCERYRNSFENNIIQSNGCRIYTNPLGSSKFPIPTDKIEIFVRNLPRDCFENEILPHFERFGPIYKFRLLIDYDNLTRGYGYLIFYLEKSALMALDVMGYYIIRKDVIVDVEISLEKSSLLAMNVPSNHSDEEIQQQFIKIFKQISNITIKRQKDTNMKESNSCKALLEFPSHKDALTAKQYGSKGTLNLWGRSVKILWYESGVDKLATDEFKEIVIHHMPENLDIRVFENMMCNYIYPHEIISIFPLKLVWLVEFTNTAAAETIMTLFHQKTIEGSKELFIEWSSGKKEHCSMKGDFDAELRLFCIANYWEPPVFIFGRAYPNEQIQHCAVIIKDNRKNAFTTFFVEIFVDKLVEVHSRVCEVVLQYVIELMSLPKLNLVMKCVYDKVFVVGAIPVLDNPQMEHSTVVSKLPLSLYLEDICMLSRLCAKLIVSSITDVYAEYQMILKHQDIHRQFISNIQTIDGNVLGCIDPKYRMGKPLKCGLNNDHMILVMCNKENRSNIWFQYPPSNFRIVNANQKKGIYLKFDTYSLISHVFTHRPEVHNCERQLIVFHHADTFSVLFKYLKEIKFIQNQLGSNPCSSFIV